MIFIIIISAFILELILASTWNPIYFRKGLLAYKKTYKINEPLFKIDDPSTYNEKFSSSWKPSFVFAKLSDYELAVREKLFQLTFASYTPIVHAYISYNPNRKELTLKCFANLTALAFFICFSYLVISSDLFAGFSAETFVVDVLLFLTIFGFLMLLFGGIALYQIQQYKLIPKYMIKKHNNTMGEGVGPSQVLEVTRGTLVPTVH